MLLSLRLTNIRRHADRAWDLAAPTVALWGPNGSGKSTVLAAAAYALTGDLRHLGGHAARRDGCGAAAAGVELTFRTRRDDAETATVSRGFSANGRAKRKLTCGAATWTHPTEVRRQLEAWLGLPPEHFVEYAFLPQGEFAAVVAAEPQARQAALSRLLGLERAEAVWQALGAEARRVVVDRAAVADWHARVAAADAAHRHALQEVWARPDEADALQDAEARLRAAEARATLDRDRAARAERRRRLLDDCDRHRAALAATPPPADPDFLEARVRDIEAAYRTRREYEEYRERAARVDARLAELPELPHPGPEPAEPPELAEARAHAATWRALARLRDACAEPVCPTCRQPLPPEQRRLVREACDALAALEQAETQHRRRLDAHRAARDAHAARARERDGLAAQRDHLRQLCAAHAPPPGPAEASGTLARELQELRRELADARRADAARATAAAALAAAEQQLALLAELAPPDAAADATPPDDPDTLRHAVDALRARAEERRLWADRAAQALARLAADRDGLAAAERQAARAAAWHDHAERMDRLRAAFHRDAAPAQLLRAYMAELQPAVNEWLLALGADYQVRLGDDCSFRADAGTGGRLLETRELSGGERMLLAWAWVAARQGRHGDGLWLLCPDEPTYGLDRERMAALTRCVRAWPRAAPGRQLLLVTHDRQLAEACDRVLEL